MTYCPHQVCHPLSKACENHFRCRLSVRGVARRLHVCTKFMNACLRASECRWRLREKVRTGSSCLSPTVPINCAINSVCPLLSQGANVCALATHKTVAMKRIVSYLNGELCREPPMATSLVLTCRTSEKTSYFTLKPSEFWPTVTCSGHSAAHYNCGQYWNWSWRKTIKHSRQKCKSSRQHRWRGFKGVSQPLNWKENWSDIERFLPPNPLSLSPRLRANSALDKVWTSGGK